MIASARPLTSESPGILNFHVIIVAIASLCPYAFLTVIESDASHGYSESLRAKSYSIDANRRLRLLKDGEWDV